MVREVGVPPLPTGPRREDTFIELFLSAYENFSWADAHKCWLDRKLDKAVEMLATRKSDGKTLAIEHTLVEPFVSDKGDYAFFEPSFLKIEDDETLVVQDHWIQVFIPVATCRRRLHGRRKAAARDAIVKAVHDWIRANRLSLPDGQTNHQCEVRGVPGSPTFEITLTIKAMRLPGHGALVVRRQQVGDDFDVVIGRVLRTKLPKLTAQNADKRILILERQHMNLVPQQILDEIERQRAGFSELSAVDEIWILETINFGQGGYLGFELYRNGKLVAGLSFQRGVLTGRHEDGIQLPT
jgi:hypothetical protein